MLEDVYWLRKFKIDTIREIKRRIINEEKRCEKEIKRLNDKVDSVVELETIPSPDTDDFRV